MGFVKSLFGGGQQQPTILPPPPAPPAANPPSIADTTAVSAGLQAKGKGAAGAAGAGFDGTLLTGGQGLGSPATAGGMKKLTGE